MVENSFQDQLKSLQKRKELLIILLFLFVIIIFWIGLSLFTSQQKLGITSEQKKLAQPLTPNINISVLEKVEQKRVFSEFELQDFPIYALYQDGGTTKVIDIRVGLPDENLIIKSDVVESTIAAEELSPISN